MNSLPLFITILVATFATLQAGPPAPQDQIALPEKCEDVLSVKACDKLKSTANTLKLKYDVVKEAVVDAVQKGKQTSRDIIDSVKGFYLEKIKDKTCSDYIKPAVCQELVNVGDRIAIKASEVTEFVKKALIAGKNTAEDVASKVKEYFHDRYSGKSCEDILDRTVFRIVQVSMCKSLRKSATAVKVTNEKLRVFVTETVMKGYNTTKEFTKNTIQQIKDFSTKVTSCETLLNPGLCNTLRSYANKTKVAFPKIMSTARDLLLTGVKVAKGFVNFVYKITDAFIDCETFFTEKSCILLKEKVAKAGGTISDLGKAVRDIATKVANKVTDTYKTVVEYTKSKLCKHLKLKCPKEGSKVKLVVKRSTGFSDLLTKYKNMLGSGITDAKAKLEESLKGIMSSMKGVDAAIRKAIEDAIANGKGKYDDVKDLLKKLLSTMTDGNSASTEVAAKVKRGLRDELKNALQRAHEDLKSAIEFLLTFTKNQLSKMKDYVNTLLKKVLYDTRNRRAIDEIDTLDELVNAMADDETTAAEIEAEDMIDNLMENAINELEDVMEEEIQAVVQKRDLTSAVERTKSFFNKVGSKLHECLAKLRTTNIEDIKKALKESGLKIIGVAEDVYKKIQAELNE